MNDPPTSPSGPVTESGLSAEHPPLETTVTSVAPSTTGSEFNTLKMLVDPVACWRVDDLCFEFDSSFPGLRIRAGLQRLTQLLERHPPASFAERRQPPDAHGCPLSIFAHADPVGDDLYNKQLSGRRAMAIYGLLTHDVELWDALFTQPLGDDRWGSPALEAMADATATSGRSVGVGGIEGDAVRRKALYQRYMALLWAPDLALQKRDFLARGADPGGKGDYQGCSEFNPLLLASRQEESGFAQDEDKIRRNRVNAPNRRVMVLIFRRGSRIDSNLWPCPRVSEGPGACRKRFWADGEARRSMRLPDQRRQYEQSKDTFACRFYDRLVSRSPCERVIRAHLIRLYDPQGKAMPHACYQVEIEGRVPFTGRAGAEGMLTLRNVEVPATCMIRWGPPPDGDAPPQYIHGLVMYLAPEDAHVNEEARKKLNNLGYIAPDLRANTRAFQHDYRELAQPPLAETGELDESTLRVLREVYRKCEVDLRNTEVR